VFFAKSSVNSFISCGSDIFDVSIGFGLYFNSLSPQSNSSVVCFFCLHGFAYTFLNIPSKYILYHRYIPAAVFLLLFGLQQIAATYHEQQLYKIRPAEEISL